VGLTDLSFMSRAVAIKAIAVSPMRIALGAQWWPFGAYMSDSATQVMQHRPCSELEIERMN